MQQQQHVVNKPVDDNAFLKADDSRQDLNL